MKDFGYDVAYFRAIDPIFGTMDDFKSMLRRAKSLGLGIIVDMVMSHTSDEHPWFEDSRIGKNGKSGWYIWANPKPDGSPPNNWLYVFGGVAWRWAEDRRYSYFNSFFSVPTDCNINNHAFQY